MQLLHDALIASLAVLGGAAATKWAALLQNRSTFEDAVLGPLGALALAMVVIYGLVKYLSHERKEAKEANEARIKLLQDQVDRLSAENTRLWQQIHGVK